jgi:hypothetical protein
MVADKARSSSKSKLLIWAEDVRETRLEKINVAALRSIYETALLIGSQVESNGGVGLNRSI